MDGKIVDRDAAMTMNNTYFTPVKAYQAESQNKSTTAHLNSNEQFSFDKLVSRQKIALKYCSANLNELLASDIKFKSPANALKPIACTPTRKEWEDSNFFGMVDDFEDNVSLFITNKLNLDMSIRKDPLANAQLRDDDMMKEPVFYLSTNLEFTNPCATEFSVEDCLQSRHQYQYSYRQPPVNHSYEDSLQSDDYRKRKRKNNLQLKILKSEFGKGDNWNKDKITSVAKMTGLSESQVYKWCWDQKKKVEEQENAFKPESGKLKPELNLKTFAFDFNPSDLQLDFDMSRDGLSKRKPDRKPFTLLPMNRD